MFQIHVIQLKIQNLIIESYIKIIIYTYIRIFFAKKKQPPVKTVQLSNRKNPAEAIINQRQVLFLLHGLKHEMCSGIPVSCV